MSFVGTEGELRPSSSYGRNRRDFCRVARQSVSKAATAPTSWTGGAGSDTLDHICLVMHGTFAMQHVLKISEPMLKRTRLLAGSSVAYRTQPKPSSLAK
jgi:hypothetical protein